jgi:hypothetical protein
MHSLRIPSCADDVIGVLVAPTLDLAVVEEAGTATFTVVLRSQPETSVTLGLTSSDPTEGSLAASAFTFTAQTWSTPQIVTVIGVDDDEFDGNMEYSVSVTSVTAAGTYNGADVFGGVIAVTTVDGNHLFLFYCLFCCNFLGYHVMHFVLQMTLQPFGLNH